MSLHELKEIKDALTVDGHAKPIKISLPTLHIPRALSAPFEQHAAPVDPCNKQIRMPFVCHPALSSILSPRSSAPLPNSLSLLQTPRERRIGAVLPGIAVQDDRLSLRSAPAHTWTHWSSRLVMTARAQTLDTQLAAQIVDGTGVVPAGPRSAPEGTCSRGARVHWILPHLLVWTRRLRPFCEANKR